MLESLDAYRIARYLKPTGHEFDGVATVFADYATPKLLSSALEYPIFLMNTAGARNACVFLKDNRCSVRTAKPRTCRMYPLSAGQNGRLDGFDYFIVSQKRHHFSGTNIRVGDWMDENFSEEDRAFVLMDIRSAAALAPILRALKKARVDEARVLEPLLFYKYFNFELDEPFLPQCERNNDVLLRVLRRMLNG
jgi:Fe-S-cluster containining protein